MCGCPHCQLIASSESKYSDVGLTEFMLYFPSQKTFFQHSTALPAFLHAVDAATPNILEETNESDLFKKYQEIRHQDFGEIVFRKQKRSRKKFNQGKLMSIARRGGVVTRLVGCRSRWSVFETETRNLVPCCLFTTLGKCTMLDQQHISIFSCLFFSFMSRSIRKSRGGFVR